MNNVDLGPFGSVPFVLLASVATPGAFWISPGLVFSILVVYGALTANWLNHPFESVVGLGIAVLLFGMVQNPLIKVLGAGHLMLATPVLLLARAVGWACEWLYRQYQGLSLSIRTHRGRIKGEGAPTIFEAGGSLVVLYFTSVLVQADYRIAKLVFAALFGSRVSAADRTGLDESGGLLMAVIFLAVGYLALELWVGVTRVPFGMLESEKAKAFVKRATLAAAALALVLAVSSVFWQQMQLSDVPPEPANSIAVYTFRASLAVLMLYCTAVLSWSLVVSIGSLALVGLLVMTTLLWVCWWPLYVAIRGFNAAQFFQAAIVSFIGHPWRSLRDWVGSFDWVRNTLHIGRFPEFRLKEIGDDLRPPLEGKLWGSWADLVKGGDRPGAPSGGPPTNGHNVSSSY